MARRVDQVDQEATAIFALLDEGHVVFTQLVVQGDGSEGQVQNCMLTPDQFLNIYAKDGK